MCCNLTTMVVMTIVMMVVVIMMMMLMVVVITNDKGNDGGDDDNSNDYFPILLQLTDHELSLATTVVDPLTIPISWSDIGGLDGLIKDLKVH